MIATAASATPITVKITPDGMKVIHKRTTTNEIVALDLFLRSGSAWEKPGEEGLSNLTMSVLPEGTKSRDAEEIAALIEGTGGALSAGSSEDMSEVYAVVTKENVDLGFDLLHDVVTQPVFPEVEIKKDREAILASLRSRKDQIFTVANDLLSEYLYGAKHPYGRPVSGREETVQKFQRKDLIRWHQEHFSPDRMTLVVVGDVPFDTVWKAATKSWGVKKISPQVGPDYPPIPGRRGPEWIQEIRPFEQSYVMVGYPAPTVNDKDYPALKILNAILGGGMSSRLFQTLRETQGLAYETDSFYPSKGQVSAFVAYIGLDRKNVEKTQEQMFAILQSVVEKGVTPIEVLNAKKYLRGQYLLDHQTMKKQAWYLGWWELLGKGYAHDTVYLKELSRVTPKDVQAAAKRCFSQPPLGVRVVNRP